MLFDTISIGERMEISESSLDKKTITYVSQVENILDKKQLLIHMPIYYGVLIRLKKNVEYNTLFFSEKGMLSFPAKVVSHTIEDGFNLTIIELQSEGERIQRREFFRFTCIIETEFYLKLDEEQEKIKEERIEENLQEVKQPFDGVIKDISGGGIRFVSNKEIDEEGLVKTTVILGGQVIPVEGRILQRQFMPRSNYKYQYRVEFVGIQEQEQDKIVQYVFEQQRRVLQRVNV